MPERSLSDQREIEKLKYKHAYKAVNYEMRKFRLKYFIQWADEIAPMFTTGDKHGMTWDSVLDVGCGRAQAIDMLKKRGAKKIQGIDFIPELKRPDVSIIDGAHSLPFDDNQFDLVMCLDVAEHLIEEEVIPVFKELFRVAKKAIRLEISHRKDVGDGPHGHLHITVYPREWWINNILLPLMPNGARWKIEKDQEPKMNLHTRMTITLQEGYIK